MAFEITANTDCNQLTETSEYCNKIVQPAAWNNMAVIYVVMETSGRPVQNPLLWELAVQKDGWMAG